MKRILLLFTICVFSQFLVAQGNSGIDISLENIEFPDSVTINDIATVRGYLKNNGNNAYVGNIALNYDIEDVMPIDFDADSEIDEVGNMPNTIILPGDSIYFQRIFTIDPTRFNERTVDLIVIWPTLVNPDDELTNNRSVKSFYVREEASPLSESDDNKGPNGNAYGYGFNNGNGNGNGNINGNGNGGNGNGNGRLAGFNSSIVYSDVVNFLTLTNSFFQIQLQNEYLIVGYEIIDVNGKLIESQSKQLTSLQYSTKQFKQTLFIRLRILNTIDNTFGVITYKM